MVPERGDVNVPILDLFIIVGKLQEIIERRRFGFCGSSRLHGMRITQNVLTHASSWTHPVVDQGEPRVRNNQMDEAFIKMLYETEHHLTNEFRI